MEKAQALQQAAVSMPQPIGVAASLLSLQRSHGNQYVQRLLRLRRMQAKLTISEPGDQYEQEADRVADTVMRMPEPIGSGGVAVSGRVKDVHSQPVSSTDAEKLHRQTMEEEMPEEEEETLQAKEVSGETPAVTPELEARLNSARGGGQPLPESVRAFFEPRFGYDFGGVRVHTDGQAVDSARSVKAHAYTLGQDIVFGSGQYAPETPAGKQLLAHELTHVVQQSGAKISSRDPSEVSRDLIAQAGSRTDLVHHREATEIMRDKATQPSPLWYQVNDAHQKLFIQIASINQQVPSPGRSDWIARLQASWAQVANGEKSDEDLKALRNDLNELKKEIAEEGALARESWKAVVEVYQEERKALEAEDEEWRQYSIKILDGRYADTARAVQIAGAYLTFDDLVPIEYMLKEKKHREYARERAERKKEGPGIASTVATGAGLGAVVTYQGKTLVRLGGEKFYISGTPPKGTWTPKGGTTSVFFIYKKSDPKKMYRLDYDTIKMGPKQGQMGWEHNQKGVSKILGLKVTNHQPAGGWGRAAGTAIRIYKWGGRALFVAGLVGTALEIYYAENKARAVAKAGGAIAGGIGGAKLGAVGGAEAGAIFGPVGAGVGAVLGGLIGGGLGAWGGSKATEYIYDLVVESLEDEDDWIVLTQDQVEPVPGAGSSGE